MANQKSNIPEMDKHLQFQQTEAEERLKREHRNWKRREKRRKDKKKTDAER